MRRLLTATLALLLGASLAWSADLTAGAKQEVRRALKQYCKDLGYDIKDSDDAFRCLVPILTDLSKANQKALLIAAIDVLQAKDAAVIAAEADALAAAQKAAAAQSSAELQIAEDQLNGIFATTTTTTAVPTTTTTLLACAYPTCNGQNVATCACGSGIAGGAHVYCCAAANTAYITLESCQAACP